MNMRFNSTLIGIMAICWIALEASATPRWPISADPAPNGDPNFWNRVNCTFGEIHPTGTDHFHGAIDIDHDTVNCPARAVENGRVLGFNGVTSDRIIVEHEYPVGSGNYYRQTRYLHLQNNIPGMTYVNNGQAVTVGQSLAAIDNGNAGGNHLHFEMWQYDENEGKWYRLNPLKNDTSWQVGSPPDISDPEMNNVLLQKWDNHPAGVTSGYTFPQQNTAITDYTANDTVKIHLRNRPGSNEAIYNPEVNTFTVFGSLRPIVNTREVDITGKPLEASNIGLTAYATGYSIEDEHHSSHETYRVEFDRIREENEYAFQEIFHPDTQTFGNNDFIELHSPDAVYLYPHKTMTGNQLHSNGIWYTKARKTNPPVYVFDNAHLPEMAYITDEALFPDGEHTLTFHVEDAAGRIDRAPGKAEDNAQVTTIVDNYRPYVKKLHMTSDTFPIYSSTWRWNQNGNRQLVLAPDASGKQADRGKPLHITVKTSEPMSLTTDANGHPTGSVQISMQTDGAAQPWLDWTNPVSITEDRTVCSIFS